MKSTLQVSLGLVATLVGIAILCAIVYQLSPVLLPFVFAATLAYLTDPLVERMQRHGKIPRTLGVVIVFLVVLSLLTLILFYLIPALIHQLTNLIQALPGIIEWMQQNLLVKLAALGFSPEQLNIETIKATLSSHMKEATKVASMLGNFLFASSMSLFAGIMQFLIIFVVTFYLLRDWPKILVASKSLIPKPYVTKTVQLVKKCDELLATFLRGQLVVMAVLAVYYTIGLALVGVRFSLLLGFLIGLLSVVPYLGSILGFAIAIAVTLVQFHEWLPIIGVIVLFGIGHILEGMVLTPLLIGDKLGLHPVAVIFAVLAGGQLMGMVGVIIALPIAAILVVLFREFYWGGKIAES